MTIESTIQITDNKVREFTKLVGDFNPIHLDEAYASRSPFKKRIAHGMLVASHFSTMIAEDFPGPGSVYLSQSINFIGPCYINDTIRFKIKLINRKKNKFYLKTTAFNDESDMILSGEALVLNKKTTKNI